MKEYDTTFKSMTLTSLAVHSNYIGHLHQTAVIRNNASYLDWLCVNARWQAEYIFYIFIAFYVRYGIVTFSTVFIKASGRQWTMPFWE